MARRKYARKRLFVDWKVQGALVLRVIVYAGMSALAISLMLLCWRIVTGPPDTFGNHIVEMWYSYGAPAVASLVLLPVVIFDVIRLSNRFVGPLVRLRRAMRALAAGEQVAPLHFRDGDFWHDLAADFNAAAARVQARDEALAGSPDQPREEELAAAAS
jgi:hypothetical protein